MLGRTSVLLLVLAICALAANLAISPSGVPQAQGQEAAKYLGAKKCMMCHQEQHKTWLAMKHSKAWEALTPEDIAGRKDEHGRLCVECHTTGYGKGGFESLEKTPALTSVGCEVCHGPGSTHMKFMMNAAMLEDEEKAEAEKAGKAAVTKVFDCARCHNPHVSYKEKYGKKE